MFSIFLTREEWMKFLRKSIDFTNCVGLFPIMALFTAKGEAEQVELRVGQQWQMETLMYDGLRFMPSTSREIHVIGLERPLSSGIEETSMVFAAFEPYVRERVVPVVKDNFHRLVANAFIWQFYTAGPSRMFTIQMRSNSDDATDTMMQLMDGYRPQG